MLYLFWRTKEQVEQVKLVFPKERGGGRLCDRRIENSHRAKKQ